MSVKGPRIVWGVAVSTTWAPTTVSARGDTCWLEGRNAKVSVSSVRSSFDVLILIEKNSQKIIF